MTLGSPAERRNPGLCCTTPMELKGDLNCEIYLLPAFYPKGITHHSPGLHLAAVLPWVNKFYVHQTKLAALPCRLGFLLHGFCDSADET
jgi:hypothetical protein